MTCGIYIITNNDNGKKYIGKSKNIERRFKQHKSDLPVSKIGKDIKKYGEDNFTFEILEECDEEELDLKEKEYIKDYGVCVWGYNKQGIRDVLNTKKTIYLNDDIRAVLDVICVIKEISPSEFINNLLEQKFNEFDVDIYSTIKELGEL